jgi:hypothetical protein
MPPGWWGPASSAGKRGELRSVSARVAAAVLHHASTCGTGRRFEDAEIERAVSEAIWWPAHVPVVKA